MSVNINKNRWKSYQYWRYRKYHIYEYFSLGRWCY